MKRYQDLMRHFGAYALHPEAALPAAEGLARLEEALGCPLPAGFQTFLHTYNRLGISYSQ